MSDTLRDKSFRLTWRDGAYYVSEPNIETQEVVSLADALDALAARDAEWRAAVERVRIPERTDHVNVPTCGACADNAHAVRWNASLDALLAAMEAQ